MAEFIFILGLTFVLLVFIALFVYVIFLSEYGRKIGNNYGN